MSIFYLEEHTTCSQYLSDVRLGFKYVEAEPGSIFNIEDKKEKHLFFILEGSVRVGYNEFPDKIFNAGEMFFLPKSADCRAEALTKCSFVVHIYDAPVRLCDQVGLNTLVSYAAKIDYEFKALPICSTLNSYLLLLKTYLVEGINCLHLHKLKQKELFIVLRTHYRKEDLARMFSPMLGKALDFRSKVMALYPDARTARELAKLCNYSEGRFGELFIAEFGEPPYKWMQKQKAKHIIGCLAQTNLSLKEIADEYNFSSQSHFNRYCKGQYGEPAAQVRRKLQASTQ